MSAEREDWARAFLRQGDSDLGVYELLARQPIAQCPRCHALHYLQMACEKIGKAYRARDPNAELTGEDGLLRKHVGFEKFMSSFLSSASVKQHYPGKTAQLLEVRKGVLKLAREVEKLAPAVDSGVTPANTEYPWQADGCVLVPCDYDFPNLSLLREAGGRTFLKFVRQAVRDF